MIINNGQMGINGCMIVQLSSGTSITQDGRMEVKIRPYTKAGDKCKKASYRKNKYKKTQEKMDILTQ